MILSLLLPAVLALPLRAEPPEEREIRAVFTKTETLLSRQAGADARTIAQFDADIGSLAPAVLRWQWRAVAPLSRILEDPNRPIKARLYAISFLSLTHDPLALSPLKKILADEFAPSVLRSAAAEALPRLDVSLEAARRPLCATLSQDGLPEDVSQQILAETARLGCDQTRLLEDRVRRAGLRPEGPKNRLAQLCLTGLSRSRPIEAARALVRLLSFYPAGSAMKPAILSALWDKRMDLPALKAAANAALTETIRIDSGYPETVAAAVPLLAQIGDPGAAPLLRRLLDHPDAEVVTVAAEALAQLQVFSMGPDIGHVLAQAREDPRFAPRPGRPQPQALLVRLQAALQRLQ